MNKTYCEHNMVICLNQHELIRKYRCTDCHGVMICACDEAFGRQFLAHQLDHGVELETQKHTPVTHDFQTNICNACRGLPLVPAPASAIPGRTSKIKRFYWRELYFAETERMAAWQRDNPYASPEEIRSIHRCIEKEVLEEMKALHARQPKYDTREPSQSEIIDRYGVEVEAFHPRYLESPQKGAVVMWEAKPVSAEYFAARQYEASGWSVMPLESTPLHAFFGVMMWPLIQDPCDPKCRMVQFGPRTAFEAGEEVSMVTTHMPEDFGAPGYGRRRVKEIKEHFAFLSPNGLSDRVILLDIFDHWRDPSENLRQYLSAHCTADVDRARRLIEILPAKAAIAILRYLVDDYWGRYVGWPDLLLWRNEAFMMVEVKSASDKLSADQMRWIADNNHILQLPFRIAKLHRTQSARPTA
jgi:hypothetical protein